MPSLKNVNLPGKENNFLQFRTRLLVLAIFFIASAYCTLNSQEKSDLLLPVMKDSNGIDFNAEQIIENNKPALVSIWYHTNNFYSYYSYELKDTTLLNGSGFIVQEDGLIGTNFHVVDGIDSLLVKTSDGTFYDAMLLILDEKNDMAILKLKNTNGTKFPVVKLGNSDLPKVGQDVFAIGSPLGYEYTISQGIIAGIRENEKVSFTDPVTYMPIEKNFEKVIQITAAISPGNSGGALFNKKGEVIGITTYTYTGYGNLNFAIAINTFSRFMHSVDLANYENSEEARKKIDESMYLSNLKLANTYKSDATNNWYYVKMRDTMKVYDTMTVKQDSLAKMNFQKAESFFNKCIGMQPDSFEVYSSLMDLYVFTENFNKAEGLYTTIKDKFQSDSLLSLLSSSLANAYSTSKEYKKALVFYEKMAAKDSTDIYIRYQIANIHEKTGNFKKAVKEYNKIIKKDSSYTQAFIQLGVIYYEKLHDTRKAKQYLSQAYEREITLYSSTYYVDLPYYLGLIALKEGKRFEALLFYFELKNIYTYTPEDNAKKLALLKELRK
jgi:tetratricopeptide (TPR) repeat protein